MTTTAQNPMKTLYQRLRAVGFDTPYVQNMALPSWWEDSVAEAESGYQEGLLLLSRHLGLSLKSLQDSAAPLELRDFGPCNFKKTQGVTEDELAIARSICTRAAQIAAASIPTPWNGRIPADGSEIREAILSAGARWVSLSSLVDWCWNNGIPLLHVTSFPRSSRKMDGMAALVDGRPVIVLCKNVKQEAWLLFILAHELGHIVRGHVSQNGVLVDEHIAKDSTDDQETEANATAIEILTGDSDCRFSSPGRWPNAKDLADAAKEHGRIHQIEPGHIVLNYSNYKGPSFHALGNAALKLIYPHPDATKLVHDKMAANLDWSGIPEDSSEFLMRVSSPKRRK
ncbi:MAG: ImmA/IrrE family metallo-endopeptidase [Pirellulaceae bacterium]